MRSEDGWESIVTALAKAQKASNILAPLLQQSWSTTLLQDTVLQSGSPRNPRVSTINTAHVNLQLFSLVNSLLRHFSVDVTYCYLSVSTLKYS